MIRLASLLIVLLLGGPALAQGCPEKYRFVDFGLVGPDGVLRRGGTIFRAFGPDGQTLLLVDGTLCETVEDLARDGRGLPIPVVSRIEMNPGLLPTGLTTVTLSTRPEAAAEAEAVAGPHRARLARGAAEARTDRFLCLAEAGMASCQLVSPYGRNEPLVATCDAAVCRVPVLLRDGRMAVSASWQREAVDLPALGTEIVFRLQQVHDLLEAQI